MVVARIVGQFWGRLFLLARASKTPDKLVNVGIWLIAPVPIRVDVNDRNSGTLPKANEGPTQLGLSGRHCHGSPNLPRKTTNQ